MSEKKTTETNLMPRKKNSKKRAMIFLGLTSRGGRGGGSLGICFLFFHWKIMCSLCPLLSTGSSPPLSPWRTSFSRSEKVGVGVAAASSPEFSGTFSPLFSLSWKLPNHSINSKM